MLLLVLAHVDAHHGALVIEEELGQGAGQLGLAHPGRAEEDERADRPVGVLQPGARAAHGVGDGAQGVVLPDHPAVQAVFHLDQLLGLAFHQAGDRDAGPAGDHLGDLLGVHFFLEQRALGLHLLQAAFILGQLRFQLAQVAVAQARRLFRIPRGARRARSPGGCSRSAAWYRAGWR